MSVIEYLQKHAGESSEACVSKCLKIGNYDIIDSLNTCRDEPWKDTV